MKKVFKNVVCLFLMLIMSFSASANQSELPITVFVDGEQIVFDVEPTIEGGRTLVPMRYIFEALGAEVDWVPETVTAVAVKGDIKIEITVGKNVMVKNGSSVAIDVPAKLTGGRTLVPVRAVSEGLEAKVDWDAKLRKVIITSNSTSTVEKTEYSMCELSPEDTELLKDMEYDIRYMFEQQVLPGEVFVASDELVPYIKNESKDISDTVYEIWDRFLARTIMELQNNSKYTYTLNNDNDDITVDDVIAVYGEITKNLGMDSHSNFETSYTTTPGGKKVLLLTFAKTDYDNPIAIVSKYIAIVPCNDGCRYFTAEISPIALEILGKETWVLGEVTESGRGNYGMIDQITKEGFLEKIDNVIDKKLKFKAGM